MCPINYNLVGELRSMSWHLGFLRLALKPTILDGKGRVEDRLTIDLKVLGIL